MHVSLERFQHSWNEDYIQMNCFLAMPQKENIWQMANFKMLIFILVNRESHPGSSQARSTDVSFHPSDALWNILFGDEDSENLAPFPVL